MDNFRNAYAVDEVEEDTEVTSAQRSQERMSKYGLTYDEDSTIVSYKPGDSYALNGKLTEAAELDAHQKWMRDNIDTALEKLPVYTGTVYRHYSFDVFGGKEALIDFIKKFSKGESINLGGYISASTVENTDRTGGTYTVDMVIDSNTARSLDGFGENTENEVLFARTVKLIPTSMEKVGEHRIGIELTEEIKNETGKADDTSPDEVRNVREVEGLRENVRDLSGQDTGIVSEQSFGNNGRDGQDAGVPELRAGERFGSARDAGVESTDRLSEVKAEAETNPTRLQLTCITTCHQAAAAQLHEGEQP